MGLKKNRQELGFLHKEALLGQANAVGFVHYYWFGHHANFTGYVLGIANHAKRHSLLARPLRS